MSYVDALFDRDSDIIRVVERKDGKRHFHEYQAKYTFYYEDPRGKYKSVYGDPLTRIVCKNTKDFRKEVAINKGKNLFESDINPIFQCLSENYLNQDAPKLNVCFFDIETDFDPERGFADPSDPFMPITAITVHLQWLNALVTLALPPKTLTMDQAKDEVKEWGDECILFDNEGDMLQTFLDLIEDADIITGWNSEGYDIPYTVNRVSRVLSKDDTRRFCLWKQLPKKREYEKYGKSAVTFDLIGRVHLDSLELYRKYTYEERHTYRLDAIGEIEVGENKVPSYGTLFSPTSISPMASSLYVCLSSYVYLRYNSKLSKCTLPIRSKVTADLPYFSYSRFLGNCPHKQNLRVSSLLSTRLVLLTVYGIS